MASNSAQQELSYQTPVSFDDFWRASSTSSSITGLKNPNSFAAKVFNAFTGEVTSAKQKYENYLAGIEANNNAYYAQEANKKTWAREDSQVQRSMADYSAAGLNPYLLLTNGNAASSAVSSAAQTSSYKRSSKSSEGKEESKALNAAMKVLALIILKKAL